MLSSDVIPQLAEPALADPLDLAQLFDRADDRAARASPGCAAR